MAWEYKHTERTFETVPEGKHRVRIAEVERGQSKSGNDMLKITLEVSGMRPKLRHWIVFLDNNPQFTNQKLTEFFESFAGIEEGNFDTNTWVGQTGAAMVKHEDYNGNPSAKISYFIKSGKYDDLPPWVEPDGTEVDADGFMQAPAETEELFG